MRLYKPLKALFGLRLRVFIYARYSTEEQKKLSITAQLSCCRKWLVNWGIEDAEIVEIADEGISGEVVNRPGIDRLREAIKTRSGDLILAEDSSRLFRNLAACKDFVGSAADKEIRVILPGDDVDTAREDWVENLEDAQMHHCRSNNYTRKRIKRTQDELWEMGAAVGMLKSGFRRRASIPATEKGPAEGPFFDSVDPQWAPIVREIFERIARDDEPWTVAKWTTTTGFPKAANAKGPAWTDKGILALIRNTVYRGREEYRKKISKKIYNSQAHNAGRSKSVRNEPEKVMVRQVERIVEDDLWHRANKAIDDRNLNPNAPCGIDHPLANIPRDSRGPLSNLFLCEICGQKMHIQGRADGGYRCSHAKTGPCWNRATALENLTHRQIGGRVVAELLTEPGFLDALVRHVEQLFLSDEPRKRRQEELRAEIRTKTQQRDRILDLLESGSADSSSLQERLRQREGELQRAKEELAQNEQHDHQVPQFPSRDELQAILQTAAAELLNMGPEAASLLKRVLDGPILAVPYQQFESNKVVLRAEFKVCLLGLLPNDLFLLLERLKVEASDLTVTTRTVLVDLFEPSAVPKHALAAWAMLSAGKTRKEIQLALGISKRIACQAVRLGEQMAAAGLTDPFVRLEKAPATASRWGKRKRKGDNGGSAATEPAAA